MGNNGTANVFSLQNELAIITGGGTGLGFAMASCFVAAGARVVLTGRRVDVLENAVQQLGSAAAYEVHDVTELDSCRDLVARIAERHGAPTILVNNAGVHAKKSLEEHSFEDFHSVIGTHVEGAFAMSQAVVPYMKKAEHGSILFVASMVSFIGMPNVIAYSAAKSAYLGMVRCLATELGPTNIRTNAIAPGWIQTPMLDKALGGDPPRKAKILARTPQQKFGVPSDIGWAAVYLCSPAAAFVNGVVLPVDGGANIGF